MIHFPPMILLLLLPLVLGGAVSQSARCAAPLRRASA